MTLTLTDVTVRRGIGPVISDVSLEIVPGVGHFLWLDDPDAYWPIITGFVRETAAR